MSDIVYNASKTLSQFHLGQEFVRGVMGPIGSGKSVACCLEIIRRSKLQEPFHSPGSKRGIRYTRWVVVRNTYRELLDTTMETFFAWVPKNLGHYVAIHNKFIMDILLDDGTVMHMEILFRALDRPDDVKKLLSLEMTGLWLNEAREIPKAILDMGVGRVGRYPPKALGGPTWFGVIMDTNPPDSDHWWYKLFEETRPEGYKLFKQPSGVGPEAENIENLPPRYYDNIMAGKDNEWINVYVHGKYGFVQDGKPIYPEYKDDVHHTEDELKPIPGLPIFIGIDFGLTPAATFGQETSTGRWTIFDELVTEDMGAVNFSRLLRKHMLAHYPGFEFEIYGDPAGDTRSQTDETTPFQILAANGIPASPTYTNDFILRREAVVGPMIRLDSTGNPAFVIGPKAKLLRKAMSGGYKYRRMAVSGQDRFTDKPDKNRYSHVAESLQYLLLGAGEGIKVIDSPSSKDIDYSQYDRMYV